MHELIRKAPQIEALIGYTFRDKNLLALAFVHRSYVNESRYWAQHNERLELLGDSVLGLLISDHLYHMFPDTQEGDLSSMRARLVEASACTTYLTKLHVGSFLMMGRGERLNDGRGRESILADLFEAIVGAIYLDGGLEAARSFFFKTFSQEIATILQTPNQNWKALLQDYCQKRYQKTPEYLLIEENGPDHSKTFLVAVQVMGQELGRGTGASKKEAQQAAARMAMEKL